MSALRGDLLQNTRLFSTPPDRERHGRRRLGRHAPAYAFTSVDQQSNYTQAATAQKTHCRLRMPCRVGKPQQDGFNSTEFFQYT